MKRKLTSLLEWFLNILSFAGLIALLIHYSGIRKRPLSILSNISDNEFYGVWNIPDNYSSSYLYHSLKESHKIERRELATSEELRGVLKVEIWSHICGNDFKHLFNSPLFPSYPDVEFYISRTYIKQSRNNYGMRIYGYLSPPITGFYKFIIYSDSNSVFWFSETYKVDGLRQLAWFSSRAESGSVKSSEVHSQLQISETVYLVSDMKYAIEIFHYQGQGIGFFEIQWIKPGESSFVIIEKEFLSCTQEVRELPRHIWKDKSQNKSSVDNFSKQEPAFFHVAFLTEWIRKAAIPVCSHKIEANVKQHIYRYHGHKTIKSSVSLYNGTWIQNGKIQPSEPVSTVVKLYMEALERVVPKRLKVRKIQNLEYLPTDSKYGTVYLMELEFDTDGLEYTERSIEYVHLNSGLNNAKTLCYPRELLWRTNTFISVVIPVNTERSMLLRFIKRIDEIVEKSLEVYTDIIIVHSSEIYINKTATFLSTTVNYRTVQLNGTFSRSRSVNAGLRLVNRIDSIVLVTDVYVHFPVEMFEETRKRCHENQLAFLPVTFNLDCGNYPNMKDVKGKLCNNAYDVIGLYKSDWNRIGEMDEDLSSQKGDWDLVDKIVNKGLLVSRISLQGLYRYYYQQRRNDIVPQSLENTNGAFQP